MRAFLVGFFMLLTAIAAQIKVPMPPFGVPQTLQTLVVILAALHLGPRWGWMSMLLYVVIGLAGAPIFADGASGLAVLLGQTGGYLVGFVLSQPVIAWCVRRRDGSARGWLGIVLASVLGHLVVFAVGVPWLYVVRTIGAEHGANEPLTAWNAVYGGMVIFLPGMVIKCLIAMLIARAALPWAMKRVW
jgi:biotin transport system substrate-specific component